MQYFAEPQLGRGECRKQGQRGMSPFYGPCCYASQRYAFKSMPREREGEEKGDILDTRDAKPTGLVQNN